MIQSLPKVRCYLSLHIRAEQSQGNLSQVSRCRGRESKHSPIEHKSGTLPLELTHLMRREIILHVHAWSESQLKCPPVRSSLFRSVDGGRRHLFPFLSLLSTFLHKERNKVCLLYYNTFPDKERHRMYSLDNTATTAAYNKFH
jgi:hypothetical protein